jgi:BirA family transcriptional regulator, biotin operon repressor / biotin---[acetyl-CoA-carboxylase] ligase
MTSQASSRASRPNPLAADAIRSGLRTKRFGWTLHLYDRLESTNTTALALAETGAPEGTVILADSQTRGRGRMGRVWLSPPNVNLYVSIILRPERVAARIGLWSLAAAVAVARTLEQTLALPARLKWPNDILVRDKKVSGLLLESATQNGRSKYLILGIGLNVNLTRDSLPETLRTSVTSLREECGREIDRIEILQRLLEQIELHYQNFRTKPPQAILESYTALSETLGQTVRVLEKNRKWTGNVVGFTPDGALVVQKPDGQNVIVYSEDVVHLKRTSASASPPKVESAGPWRARKDPAPTQPHRPPPSKRKCDATRD